MCPIRVRMDKNRGGRDRCGDFRKKEFSSPREEASLLLTFSFTSVKPSHGLSPNTLA